MATEYGLHLVYKEEFHQVFEEHQDHPEFKPLLVRMKVVDNEGASAMDEDQWEAASEWLSVPFLKELLLTVGPPRYLYRICFREKVKRHCIHQLIYCIPPVLCGHCNHQFKFIE